jgi:hypothetical protein
MEIVEVTEIVSGTFDMCCFIDDMTSFYLFLYFLIFLLFL